jgi:hypothetical protein
MSRIVKSSGEVNQVFQIRCAPRRGPCDAFSAWFISFTFFQKGLNFFLEREGGLSAQFCGRKGSGRIRKL